MLALASFLQVMRSPNFLISFQCKRARGGKYQDECIWSCDIEHDVGEDLAESLVVEDLSVVLHCTVNGEAARASARLNHDAYESLFILTCPQM